MPPAWRTAGAAYSSGIASMIASRRVVSASVHPGGWEVCDHTDGMSVP